MTQLKILSPEPVGSIRALAAAFQQTADGLPFSADAETYASLPDPSTFDAIIVDAGRLPDLAGRLAPLPPVPDDFIGPSLAACRIDRTLRAYPLSATCHVSLSSAAHAPEHLGLPLQNHHAFLALCSIMASAWHPLDPVTGFPPPHELSTALMELRALAARAVPESLSWSHADALAAIRAGTITHIPLTFADSSAFDPALAVRAPHSFHVPMTQDGRHYGLIPSSPLGVFSLRAVAVSAASPHLDAATAFARFCSGKEAQTSIWITQRELPANQDAWRELVRNERRITPPVHSIAVLREQLRHAYLRPQWKGFAAFEKSAGDILHRWLADPTKSVAAADSQLRALWARCSPSS